MLAYIETWSALQRYRKATGHDPLPALAADLHPLWGEGLREVRWPMIVKAGRV